MLTRGAVSSDASMNGLGCLKVLVGATDIEPVFLALECLIESLQSLSRRGENGADGLRNVSGRGPNAARAE